MENCRRASEAKSLPLQSLREGPVSPGLVPRFPTLLVGGLCGPQCPLQKGKLEEKANPRAGAGVRLGIQETELELKLLGLPQPSTQGPRFLPASRPAEAPEEETFHEHGWSLRIYKIQAKIWDWDSVIRLILLPSPVQSLLFAGPGPFSLPYRSEVPTPFGRLPLLHAWSCCLDRVGSPSPRGRAWMPVANQ